MLVNPDHIRHAGRDVGQEASAWREHFAGIKTINTAAFGGDEVGRRIGLFHSRVHEVSISYFAEVADCCADMGAALIRTADLYADTERDNAAKAVLIKAEINNLGVV